MKDKKELKDEQLEQVSGGSSWTRKNGTEEEQEVFLKLIGARE